MPVSRASPSCREWPQPEPIDPAQDLGEQGAGHCHLGQLEDGVAPMTHDPGADLDQLLAVASHSVSKRPISLFEAAARSIISQPTMARMAGSRASRSASLTSSYPANRPNTDCRSSPISWCWVFLPRRLSDILSAPWRLFRLSD
jgi:hypothetical protein